MNTSLHKIITGYLLQRRYPIHFYAEFLIYISRGLSELNFDTLGNVRSKLISINQYGAITWPCDYMDLIGVYLRNGQYKVPMIARPSLNRLNNLDTNGDKIPYAIDSYNSGFSDLGNSDYYNDYGESIGRFSGNRGGGEASYTVIKERKEIQINAELAASEVILDYISDGTEADNATEVPPYAIATLEAYINFKHKEHSRSYSEGERMRARRQFDHEHRILRGRRSDVTIPGLRAAFNRHSHGAPK